MIFEQSEYQELIPNAIELGIDFVSWNEGVDSVSLNKVKITSKQIY